MQFTDIQHLVQSTSDPTVNDDEDDGYVIGLEWINTTTNDIFKAAAVPAGAAVWKKISP